MVNSPTVRLVGSETPLALRSNACTRAKSSEKAKGLAR